MTTQLYTYGSGVAAQATELVFYGYIEAATDTSLADLLRNPSAARTVLEDLFASDVPAIVTQALSQAPTVEAAAAQAVAGKLAAADVPLGSDKRVLPGGPFTESGWYLMPESTGYIYAYVVVESARDWYILCGITLEGYWEARTKGDAGGSGGALSRSLVPDAIPEWWVGLPQWHLDTIYTGGLGRKGEVLAIDFNARTGPVAAQVAAAIVDDHNVPGRATVPGRGTFLAWTHHGDDSLLRVCVAGGSGRADTLSGKPVATYNMGGSASYAHPWNLAHLRTGTTDTFWTFGRVALKWCIRENVADWATSTTTATPGIKQLVEFGEQAYMHVVTAVTDAFGNPTKVGIVAGHNPSANRDDVFLLELDLTKGIMHDKMNPGVTHDISSANPLQWTALTAALPDKPTGTRRVLGLYTGGGTKLWKILTVEYAGAVGPDGVITETTINVETMQIAGTRTFGAAGRHLERYPAGAQFDRNGQVWHVNEANSIYTLSLEGVAVRRSTRAIFRPSPPMPIVTPVGEPHADLLAADVGSYTDYRMWADTNLVAIKKGA